MPCTHCGAKPERGKYTLRFTPEGREPANLDLRLCGGCLEELLGDPDVELVEPPLVTTDDTPVEKLR